MNELVIWFGDQGHVYFATEKTTAKDAYLEFDEKCEKAGVDMSNLPYSELVLRDADGNDIDKQEE